MRICIDPLYPTAFGRSRLRAMGTNPRTEVESVEKIEGDILASGEARVRKPEGLAVTFETPSNPDVFEYANSKDYTFARIAESEAAESATPGMPTPKRSTLRTWPLHPWLRPANSRRDGHALFHDRATHRSKRLIWTQGLHCIQYNGINFLKPNNRWLMSSAP